MRHKHVVLGLGDGEHGVGRHGDERSLGSDRVCGHGGGSEKLGGMKLRIDERAGRGEDGGGEWRWEGRGL
eukprot:418300-Hanusia_phi.AAC.1